ncbi:hypothetical protein Lfu02_07790 [Longispora fulva]|nr:hypothetical protein Lfu02_07790 [Longispora fulva]
MYPTPPNVTVNPDGHTANGNPASAGPTNRRPSARVTTVSPDTDSRDTTCATGSLHNAPHNRPNTAARAPASSTNGVDTNPNTPIRQVRVTLQAVFLGR